MKVVTLRNVPPQLARMVRRRAAQDRASLNKTVIKLLEQSLAGRPTSPEGKPAAGTLYHDLDSLSGAWSRQEAAAFDQSLARQRAIDPELWK